MFQRFNLRYIREKYQQESQHLTACELKRGASQKINTYIPQCTQDGRYRNVQCTKDGQTCWCVNNKGDMVSSLNGITSVTACLSFCQLHRQQVLVSGYVNSSRTSYIPQCTQTGEYELVQCNTDPGQCWCVDSDGMEIYGTRQDKRPVQCPASCEVRDRRVLHGAGPRAPPQCSKDGKFLPVQCRFVNTTDMMDFDLVNNFNRFPGAFHTFSAFRRNFAEASAYCYCADNLGRELQGTGLELLLDEIYDTIFADSQLGYSFTDTGIYRILQRRFLAVHLLITGRLRCPTACEIERFTASSFGNIFTPSCDDNGNYLPVQCQASGQCWCTDSNGQEIFGTRQQSGAPDCGNGGNDCMSERKRTLSRLFYGPVGHFSQNNVFAAPASLSPTLEKIGDSLSHCSPDLKQLFIKSGMLLSIPQFVALNIGRVDLDVILSEFVQGTLLSKDLALTALPFSASPKFLVENLFGGKFLKNLAQFNFTGSVGNRGTFNFSQFFQQIGLTGMYSGGNFVELAKLFSPIEDSYFSKETSEFSKDTFNLNQTIEDNFGRPVNLQENQNIVNLIISLFERQNVLTTLHEIITLFGTDDDSLAETIRLVLRSARVGICGRQASSLFVPRCTRDGRYEEVQCQGADCWCVDSQGMEVSNSRVQGQRPQCPTKCEQERKRSIAFKSRQPAGSDLFIPSCRDDGGFQSLQCDGANCICVNLQGRKLPEIRKPVGGRMQCPSACQLSAAESFIRTVEMLLAEPSSSMGAAVYIAQCQDNGDWRQVQCDGPPQQAIEFYQQWILLNNGGQELPFTAVLNEVIGYRESSHASRNFEEFVKELYDKGHQHVFSVFSRYATFDSISDDDFAAIVTSEPGANILLNPYVFWKLLSGTLMHYPGSYSDFSVKLDNLELRRCWCVDEKGQELPGTKTETSRFAKCPGPCDRAAQQVSQFIGQAEELAVASNNSNISFTQGYLLARGIQLTENKLLQSSGMFQTGPLFPEILLSGSDYAVRLAAQSTLHFNRRKQLIKKGILGELTLKGYSPYVPQCDGFGNWNPTQCYESTGHCWCVDEIGGYVPGSLVHRFTQIPQCQTPCQRSQANAALAGWKHVGLQLNTTARDLFSANCTETGEYNILQWSNSRDGEAWCVDPVTGKAFQPAVRNSDGQPQCPSRCELLKNQVMHLEVGLGYIPVCEEIDASFSAVQCDQDKGRCWCVFINGEAIPETQVNTTTGSKPACKRPQCALPFNALAVSDGIVLCDDLPSGQSLQHCQLICRQGYHSAFDGGRFVCNIQSEINLFQVAETQRQFRLLLPSGKACSSDYSGLLKAFNTFIADDLRARGLCHIQMTVRGEMLLIPVCDDSTVSVGCLSTDILGVKVTWKVQLRNIPASFLPDLHDIEKALLGEGLIHRFTELITSGNYHLTLDSKQFPAFSDFPTGKSQDFPPSVHLGCTDGYIRVSDTQRGGHDAGGCVVCPAGSFSQGGSCILCPRGFYQEVTGSFKCNKCPKGKKTLSPGAFAVHQCLTKCEASPWKCDPQGRYRAAQQDSNALISFCVTVTGERLPWSETNGTLTESDCIVFRQFDSINQHQLILNSEDTEIIKVLTAHADHQRQLLDCLTECSGNEMCNFLTLFSKGELFQCELYNSSESNLLCDTFGQSQGFLGNSATAKYEGISCQLRISGSGEQNLSVYRKKGHEFTTSFRKTFTRTDFRNVVSGVYQAMAFSASGSSLTDVHHLCRQTCGKEHCCDGFMLSQITIDGGTFLCGLISYPDVLLCNDNDWQATSLFGGEGVCRGVKSNTKKKAFMFSFGGLDFIGTYALLAKSFVDAEYSTELTPDVKEEIQRSFNRFQRIYLWQDSNMNTRLRTAPDCTGKDPQDQQAPRVPEITRDLFLEMVPKLVQVNLNQSVPNQHYQLFKHHFPKAQAELWCLARCTEETFCKLATLRDSEALHYECVLYPDTQLCQPSRDPNVPALNCGLVLPEEPKTLFRKKDVLGGSVKNFYSRLPFRELRGISVRNKLNVTARGIQTGFFECERLCDEDSCCKGFGFLKDPRIPDLEMTCLILSSLGVQSCSEKIQSWHVLDCESADVDTLTYPFGWYQKPVSQWNSARNMCPPVSLPPLPRKVSMDNWHILKVSPVLDPTITSFDVLHVDSDTSLMTKDFRNNARDWCLSACVSSHACVTVSLQPQPSGVRCLFYPDTHSCRPGLRGHDCRILLKEAAEEIYYKKAVGGSCTGRCGKYQPDEACQCNLKCEDYADCCPDIHTCADPSLSETQPQLTSIFLPGHGILFGESQMTQVGGEWKAVNRFLGIPYAAPPTGASRFKAPSMFHWTGEWNATFYRPSCIQPGDAKAVYSTVDEDCLYLNIFVPKSIAGNNSVLVFFHNSAADYSGEKLANIDGSYLASIGSILVVTANYRVGAFGFLSDDTEVMTGNWGLLDQLAVLQWLQRNIGYFGGSPSRITIAADHSGADITSMNLVITSGTRLFERVMLLGGSALSPNAVMSKKRAKEQIINLAEEVGCPTFNKTTLLSCLRALPALTLNTAQTKLLAVSGPFQSWAPIVDGIYLQESPLAALSSGRYHKVDLLIGSAEEDGLVRRAKAIKNIEEPSGKSESKTAFYQALQNALGGEMSNSLVKSAATWFYSLQHSLADYSAFSRALENATRDYFIICPIVKMAAHWANSTQANVFMYHEPGSLSQHSASLPWDVQFIFGLPLHPESEQLFTVQERSLSLTIIQYIANFVKSGNPNHPFTFSRHSTSETLPPWPRFLDSTKGSNYKEFASTLKNKKELKATECSFWNDYVQTFLVSTDNVTENELSRDQREALLRKPVTPTQPQQAKEVY
ncbi:thyroglobulin [Mustelus asterias]